MAKVCRDIGKVANGSRHKGQASKSTILENLMERTARVGGDGQLGIRHSLFREQAGHVGQDRD
eukprot:6490107-Pyramimonas_sp.AAC.1